MGKGAILRECLAAGCRELIPLSMSRCPVHERARERVRGTPSARGYGKQWQRRSLRERAEHPWCTLCGSTEDLTLDHVINGVADQTMVLCRSCNTTKRNLERAMGPRRA